MSRTEQATTNAKYDRVCERLAVATALASLPGPTGETGLKLIAQLEAEKVQLLRLVVAEMEAGCSAR